MRIGQGFDAHRLEEGRVLVIGGVEIPNHPGLAGHSDADVLSHSIADALLGAAGLGDLGAHFPDDDRWRGASSLEILRHTAFLLAERGFRIVNVDATIVAESPRLNSYRDDMVDNIAGALGIANAGVSVKATSTDGLGFTGRGQGMTASAVALITS